MCYAKLPRQFFIPTPVGHYTPDWVVILKDGISSQRWFLVETKGSMLESQLRFVEHAKITCVKRLFAQHFPQIHFCVADDFFHFMDQALSL